MSHPLERGLKRLMLLRVVMITTLLLVAVYVEAVSETLLSVNPLYVLIAATYGLTLVYVAALRLVASLEAQVYAQVVGDLVIITGLVYLTGGSGLRAGFLLLYPISVLSGSVLLYRRKGLLLAGLAMLFYGALLWAVRSGAVPRWGLTDVPQLPVRHVLYSVFVIGIGCATVAMIGGYLAESLSRAGRRLEEAAVQVADLQELNKLIVDSIQSGLITTDRAGRILYVNAFGAAVLGCTRVELRGRGLREVFGAELLGEPTTGEPSGTRAPTRLEVRYQRPDGSRLDLGVSSSPLNNTEPGLGGHLVVFKDVTDTKRLEQEVRTKEKLAAVGEMAAYLAHEIRNPLGSISGSAQVLLAEHGLSPEHEHLLRIITRESKRLSETLTDFLAQARPDVRPKDTIDLGPVIDEAVTLLRNGADVLPTHLVEFRRDRQPLPCLADRDRIAQVFWNLARNGLQAMPRGGVLNVGLRREADEVVLTVRDQGPGLTGEEHRQIFEPFHSRRPRGTGLGLAIVYRIVREHRGDITLRSAPPDGTEVEIRLPLVAQVVPA